MPLTGNLAITSTEESANSARAGIRRLVAIETIRSLDRSLAGAVVLAAGTFLLLAIFVRADPAPGLTFSSSPWSDEGFNAVNARNLVLFGRFATDDWSRWLVTLPFSSLLAAVFALLGPGIVQARLLSICATALTTGLIAGALRGPFGTRAALVSAAGFATSALTLYYGRLVYFENVETPAILVGALTLVWLDRRRPVRLGLGAGIAFSIAIATKPSAFFSIAGLLVFLAIAFRRDASVRRWIAGAGCAMTAAAAAWALAFGLPNADALRRAVELWPQIVWPDSLASAATAIAAYAGPAGDRGLLLMAPLLAGAAAGLVIALVRRSAFDRTSRRLVVASLGWFLVWFAVLLVSSYRPNRYLVQILPALAILVAPAVAVLDRRATAWRPSVARLLAAGLALALAVQGLVSYAGWISEATYTLPDVQARMAATLPDGLVTVGGETPTLLMSASVEVVVPWGAPATVNGGDLYERLGARAYLVPAGTTPQPVASDHPAAWAARQLVGCTAYGGATWCLYRLP